MSFCGTVKQELAHATLRGQEARKAQLAGITHAAGFLRIGSVFGVEYASETRDVALHIAELASRLYAVKSEITIRRPEHRRAALAYAVLSGPGVEQMLTEAGLFRRGEEGVELLQTVPEHVTHSRACKRAFLRGVFLGTGLMLEPKRAYRLELVCRTEYLCEAVRSLFREFGCEAKTVRRKERYVVYLKEGDSIATFLTLMGASDAMLQFEEARVERDLRNYLNRTNNCETANIGKTVQAAGDQLDAIEKIRRSGGIQKLSPLLRETAELRLNNPDASLLELAELAGTGKSGMNHRLQRLLRLAEEMP